MEIWALQRRIPLPRMEITYAQLPGFFNIHDGWYYPVGGGSGRRAVGPRSAFKLPLDYDSLMEAEEFAPDVYRQVMNRARANPQFIQAWQRYQREYAALKRNHLSHVCNKEGLEQLLGNARNRLLAQPNRGRGCSNFRY